MGIADVTNENLVHCIYPADNGKNYIVRLKKYRQVAGLFALVSDFVGTPDGYLPGNIKMRTITVKVDSGAAGPGRRERLPFADTSNAAWTTGGTAVTLDGIATTVIGRTGEKTKFL